MEIFSQSPEIIFNNNLFYKKYKYLILENYLKLFDSKYIELSEILQKHFVGIEYLFSIEYNRLNSIVYNILINVSLVNKKVKDVKKITDAMFYNSLSLIEKAKIGQNERVKELIFMGVIINLISRWDD